MIAAKVSKHSIISRSNLRDNDVRIIAKEDFEIMNSLDHAEILRNGSMFRFGDDDMQNFTLLRFHVPELMKYDGKALVIDPDIFLVRNGIEKIFDIDTQDQVLLSRKGKKINCWSSSVMLLNNKKLEHWNLSNLINKMKNRELDYSELINLKFEKNSIGQLDKCWNEFDEINHGTILLHCTEKITQPWRAGLRMNSSIPKLFGFLPREYIYRLFGKDLRTGREHPSDEVSIFFFNELKKTLESNIITEDEISQAISLGLIRQDILSLI